MRSKTIGERPSALLLTTARVLSPSDSRSRSCRSGWITDIWATFEINEGRLARAAELATEAIALSRGYASDDVLAAALQTGGLVELAKRNLERAEAMMMEAFRIVLLGPDKGLILDCVNGLM